MGGVIFLNSNSKLTEYLKWLLITYVFVGIVLLFSSKLILDLTLSSVYNNSSVRSMYSRLRNFKIK